MKVARFRKHLALTPDDGETLYLFGEHGYLDRVDGNWVAHIVHKSHYLRTADFSDLTAASAREPQEIRLNECGVIPMLSYLGVPPTAREQLSLNPRKIGLKN